MSPELVQVLVGGIALGCIYSLVGMGFVVMYRATKVLSLAQGNFMVLGALIFYSLTTSAKLSAAIAFLPSLIIVAILAGTIYRLIFARVSGGEPWIASIGTVGLSLILAFFTSLFWGSGTRELPALVQGSVVSFGGVSSLSATNLFTIGLTLSVAIALIAAIQFTKVGMQMRAVADAPTLAMYLGVKVYWLSGLAWAAGAATAAAAGIAFGLSSIVDPNGLPALGILAFPAIILGGIDSIVGALLGGIIIGIVGNFVSYKFGGNWGTVVTFIILLIVLRFRPYGLLGSQDASRV